MIEGKYKVSTTITLELEVDLIVNALDEDDAGDKAEEISDTLSIILSEGLVSRSLKEEIEELESIGSFRCKDVFIDDTETLIKPEEDEEEEEDDNL